jgi:hypothetical protein
VVEPIFRPAELNREVATLDEPGLAEPPAEGSQRGPIESTITLRHFDAL